jgi:predicted DNA-binding transcriptional regulator AlpA
MSDLALMMLHFSDLKSAKIVGNRMTLRRWMERREDPFPRPVPLSKNSLAWRARDVQDWLDRRANAEFSEAAMRSARTADALKAAADALKAAKRARRDHAPSEPVEAA